MILPNAIPEGGVKIETGRHFFEKAEDNPCAGCSAPCCQGFFFPYPTPNTYMDLDAMLYMLGFPSTQMILNSDGNWKVMVEGNCRFFDQESRLCTLYDTTRRPKTCVYFNPYQCWHKRNFHENPNPQEIIRIDLAALEAILDYVHFDEDGDIIEIPEWELLRTLANNQRSADPAVAVQPTAADMNMNAAPDH